MKKIGVLLPQSKAYPKIAKDFMKGLRLALNDSVDLKIEGIGFSNDSKSIINSIEKLINQEGVELLTGLLGHYELDDICNYIENIEETLIFADMGAAIPPNLEHKKILFATLLV